MSYKEKITKLSSEQLKWLVHKSKQKNSSQWDSGADYTKAAFPLSFGQKRIWFQLELESISTNYNIPLAFSVLLGEPLDLHFVNKIANEIIRKHEMLRATFHILDGQIEQHIHPFLEIDISYKDLRKDDPCIARKDGLKCASRDAAQLFDLERGPLLRFSIFQTERTEYIFLIVSHHLVSDGWSNQLFFDELSKRLFSVSQNQTVVKSYRDFVFWEKKRYEGSYLDELLRFWKKHLEGELSATQLLKTSLNAKSIPSKGAQSVFLIEKDLNLQIQEFSKKNKITSFVILLAAFKALLFRYTGEKDLFIGLPYANRSLAEFQTTFGLFINMVPFRSFINEREPFLSYLQEINKTIKQVLEYAEIPFNLLVEKLNYLNRINPIPAFHIIFVHQNFPAVYQSEGVKITPLSIDIGQAQYPLSFIIEEFQDELYVKIKYRADFYEDSFISQFFDHYKNILTSVLSDPLQPLQSISFLSMQEKYAILNRAHHPNWLSYEAPPLFCELFEGWALTSPDSIALESLDAVFTYHQLNIKANQLARYLMRFYQSKGARIGVMLERTELFPIALLAVFKMGAAFIPIDSYAPQARIEYLLKSVQIDLFITVSNLESFYTSEETSKVPKICIDLKIQEWSKESGDNLSVEILREDLAYVIFTSGSTGAPKGVAIEHGQLASYIQSIDHELDRFNLSRFAFTATIAADMGYTNLFLPLAKGQTVIMIPKFITDDPNLLAEFLKNQSVDCLKWVPSQLSFLLKGTTPGAILPKQLLILAGEPTPYQLIRQVKELVPDCSIIVSYGPTETTIGAMTNQSVTTNEWDVHPLLGHPNLNTTIYILDEAMQPVPIGVAGEIYIGGPAVARGYFNRPEANSVQFPFDPFTNEKGARLYKTGDKARYLCNYEVEFLGRMDRQLKIRGYRIEPEELEFYLLQMPEVEKAVIVSTGEAGDTRLVALVILKEENVISEKELKGRLSTWFPFHMVPSRFVFVSMFPLTSTGKIDRRALPLLINNVVHSQKNSSPRDSIELILVRIWENLLRIESLGIQDNFFDLGGHSLLALELMLKIEETFKIKFPLALLFENPTIELLGERIRNSSFASYQKILVPMKRERESKASMFFIHPAGGQVLCYYDLIKRLSGAQAIYGLQSPFVEIEEHKAHQTIHKIAELYLNQIEDAILTSDYFLFGGWSLGGLIAFEMASQVAEKTKHRPRVLILDQPVPSEADLKKSSDADYVMRFLTQVENFNEVHFGVKYEDLCDKPFESLANIVRSMLIEKNLLPNKIKEHDFLMFLSLQKTQSSASLTYRPRQYAGPVLLLRAETSQSNKHPDASLGWQCLATNLTIQSVPGTHVSMMKPPHIELVADALNRWIAR